MACGRSVSTSDRLVVRWHAVAQFPPHLLSAHDGVVSDYLLVRTDFLVRTDAFEPGGREV